MGTSLGRWEEWEIRCWWVVKIHLQNVFKVHSKCRLLSIRNGLGVYQFIQHGNHVSNNRQRTWMIVLNHSYSSLLKQFRWYGYLTQHNTIRSGAVPQVQIIYAQLFNFIAEFTQTPSINPIIICLLHIGQGISPPATRAHCWPWFRFVSGVLCLINMQIKFVNIRSRVLLLHAGRRVYFETRECDAKSEPPEPANHP